MITVSEFNEIANEAIDFVYYLKVMKKRYVVDLTRS